MTLLQEGLSKWCREHESQKAELLSFLMEYGAAIPGDGTLGETLMTAYEAKSRATGRSIQSIISFIFDSDDVDVVTGRIQIMT